MRPRTDALDVAAWTSLEISARAICVECQPQIQIRGAMECVVGVPNPGIEPTSPALADGFFTTESPEKPILNST